MGIHVRIVIHTLHCLYVVSGNGDKQSDAELVEVLAQKVYELGVAVGINMNWKGQGVTKKLLQDTVYTLADHAYEAQGTTC